MIKLPFILFFISVVDHSYGHFPPRPPPNFCSSPGPSGNCACTLEWAPICGSNCCTFPNRCALKCDQQLQPNLFPIYEGECSKDCRPNNPPPFPQPRPSPFPPQPLCNNPGSPGCMCPAVVDPVCGSDCCTYGNSCELGCTQKVKPGLFQLNEGECSKFCRPVSNPPIPPPPPPQPQPNCNKPGSPDCVCPMHYDPVCGSDCCTYGNSCQLGCTQKLFPGLQQLYSHECPANCRPWVG